MQATHTPSKRELMLGKILQSCYRAALNCEQHLQAYTKLIPAADTNTDELLAAVDALPGHLRQHRAAYHSTASPGFSEEHDFEDCPAASSTPTRDFHLYKACMWAIITKEVLESYQRVDVPCDGKADAAELHQQVELLNSLIDLPIAGNLVAPETDYSFIAEAYERMKSFYQNGEIIANALSEQP